MKQHNNQYNSEYIYEIQYKSPVEAHIDHSKTAASITQVAVIGESLNTNAETLCKLGAAVYNNRRVISAMGLGVAVPLIERDFNQPLANVTETVENVQMAGKVISAASSLALAAYIGYQLYENLQNDMAKVALYNILEWGRVKICLAVPKKPTPNFKFCGISFFPFSYFNSAYENMVLYDARLFLKNCYSGMSIFILGNFIYHIDQVLDKFLDDNKNQNFTDALQERDYARSKLESRKKYLCVEDSYINNCLTTMYKYGQFPNDYEYGHIKPKQIQIINNYLKIDLIAREKMYMISSGLAFLFKTLQFTFDLLNEGEYKFNHYYKNEFLKYVQKKDFDYSVQYLRYAEDGERRLYKRVFKHRLNEPENIYHEHHPEIRMHKLHPDETNTIFRINCPRTKQIRNEVDSLTNEINLIKNSIERT